MPKAPLSRKLPPALRSDPHISPLAKRLYVVLSDLAAGGQRTPTFAMLADLLAVRRKEHSDHAIHELEWSGWLTRTWVGGFKPSLFTLHAERGPTIHERFFLR